MKRLIIAGAAAIAMISATPAFAGNWTGCYVGGSVGGMFWGKTEVSFGSTVGLNSEPTGFIGGGQAGCDYQAASNWLVGVQGEFNWANVRSEQTTLTFPVAIDTVNAKTDWFASATGRIGYASGPFLLYGKGGAAWVKDKIHDVGVVLFSSFDYSGQPTFTGWVVGGGLEYAFAPNWSATFEYDYYEFGTSSATLSGSSVVLGNPGPTTESASVKQNFTVLKFGLNYRFSSVQ